MTISSGDTSVSKATQLDYAVPASKIAALSSGDFVGFVADNPELRIDLKMFHCSVQNDHEAIAREEAGYRAIPVVEYVSEETVVENYRQIKVDIAELLRLELVGVEAGKLSSNSAVGDTREDEVKQALSM